MTNSRRAWRDFAIAFVVNATLVLTWYGTPPPAWLMVASYAAMLTAIAFLARAIWITLRK